ncbi:MAG: hypothetical protein ABJH45_17040 [Paracoccaceae bacterium]
MIKRIGPVLVAATFATSLPADGLDTFYVEDVGPSSDGTLSYKQDWSGVYLTETFGGVHEIFVRGDGKHGSFHGVLELRCADPEQSRWLTDSVYHMGNDRVPLAAIREIRRLYCVGDG